jgi:diphosphomevalonate decarboxylase
MKATAKAHSNMALIKYWGKRDKVLILPCNSSFSMTVDALYTITTVEFKSGLNDDVLYLNESEADEKARLKVSRFLDIVRGIAGTTLHAEVTSKNGFPTGAGLASSASGFAALACASTHALNLDMDGQALSSLARRGSGSACRSIYGGFVEWQMGVEKDGSDSYAIPVAPSEHWDLTMLITTITNDHKDISSREGMQRTVETSPYYKGWLETIDEDLLQAKEAVLARNFEALGQVAERNALKMHAAMMSANPPFFYWHEATLSVMRQVQALRKAGVPAYFTIDAGANVVVLCERKNAETIQKSLLKISGVQEVIVTGPGPGVMIL